MESDESTNNFDPEFTSADIRDVGVEDMDLDDDDPSEAWVSQSIGGSGFTHTPNGPLGSERPKSTSPLSPLSPHMTNGSTAATFSAIAASNSRPQGIQIKRQKNKNVAGSPLTNSVQENFRGFTYSGGESLILPMLNGRGNKDNDNNQAVDDEDLHEITTEDEAEDTGRSAGRYANARRMNGFHSDADDDMS